VGKRTIIHGACAPNPPPAGCNTLIEIRQAEAAGWYRREKGTVWLDRGGEAMVGRRPRA